VPNDLLELSGTWKRQEGPSPIVLHVAGQTGATGRQTRQFEEPEMNCGTINRTSVAEATAVRTGGQTGVHLRRRTPFAPQASKSLRCAVPLAGLGAGSVLDEAGNEWVLTHRCRPPERAPCA
jgi:hypothetical protein